MTTRSKLVTFIDVDTAAFISSKLIARLAVAGGACWGVHALMGTYRRGAVRLLRADYALVTSVSTLRDGVTNMLCLEAS